MEWKPTILRSPEQYIWRFLVTVHLNDRDLTQKGWQESAIKLLQKNTLIQEKIFEKQRMICWDSKEGIARLQRSGITEKARFWQILRYSETQLPRYCGIASAVIVLNASSVSDKPFTQKGLVESIPSHGLSPLKREDCDVYREEVDRRGISLTELAHVLAMHALKVETYKAADLTEEAIRKAILPALNHSNCYVLALYLRGPLQENSGGGHWSPLLAYDAKSDSLLLLDVSRLKHPPKWVNATAFINAAQTRTNVNGWSRGFLILRK